MLGDDLPAHEQDHQHRHKRDGKDRRRRHRECLRESERAEQPPFLGFQREDRHERDGDDEKAEKQRGANLFRRLDDDLGARFAFLCALEMLVRVFDHHDRAVDHRADGDGNAAEAHDVCAEAEPAHGGKGHEDAYGQHQNGDERAANVQEKDDADKSDDGALFQERAFQSVDSGVDEVRTVVDRNDVRARGQARR